MKLYYAPDSCALAAHIALVEAGLDYQLERVDHSSWKTEAGIDFATINPKRCVPALGIGNGVVLTESAAILQYIADLVPRSGLAPPPGSFERYRLAEWLSFVATELHQGFMRFRIPELPPAAIAHIQQRLVARYALVESVLASSSYLLGETLSVADIFLYVTTRWCPVIGLQLQQWPSLSRFVGEIAARPAVLRALGMEGLSA
jgi:glutathione S-transferase